MGMDERVHHLAARFPDVKVHLYGKAFRPGRKLGHVNVAGSDLGELRRRARLAARWLGDGVWPDGYDIHQLPADAPIGSRGPLVADGNSTGLQADGSSAGFAGRTAGRHQWGNPQWRGSAMTQPQRQRPGGRADHGLRFRLAGDVRCGELLDEFGVTYEVGVISAHRTPHRMLDYAGSAAGRGLRVIIAGAGGAAHLPGMVASATVLPVIGVPVPLATLDGMDSLLSIVQMPAGIPVACVSIGGARNAGLLAVRILASAPGDGDLAERLAMFAGDLETTVLGKHQALRELSGH